MKQLKILLITALLGFIGLVHAEEFNRADPELWPVMKEAFF